jgi:hypothetical protein
VCNRHDLWITLVCIYLERVEYAGSDSLIRALRRIHHKKRLIQPVPAGDYMEILRQNSAYSATLPKGLPYRRSSPRYDSRLRL